MSQANPILFFITAFAVLINTYEDDIWEVWRGIALVIATFASVLQWKLNVRCVLDKYLMLRENEQFIKFKKFDPNWYIVWM